MQFETKLRSKEVEKNSHGFWGGRMVGVGSTKQPSGGIKHHNAVKDGTPPL